MFDSQFMALPGITPQEYSYLQTATNGLNEQQIRTSLMIYTGKRKNSSDILIFTLLGFIWLAGVQRFMLGQIGMGCLLYTSRCV